MKNKKRILAISGMIIFVAITFFGILFSKKLIYASWIEDEDGIKYQQEDGQYAIGFVDIEEQRYYFDEEGYLVKGKFYVTEEDAYYFSDAEGVVQYGVIHAEEDFYITNENGSLKKGFAEQDNKRYYFDDKAQLVTGWFKYEGNWYYADDNGVIMTGFITVDGYRYYLNADGTRVSDAILAIDGVTYIFNKDGSVDENATMLYPVFEYLNQVRVQHGLSDLVLNTKIQACAILRASELEYGFHSNTMDALVNLLKNRGVMCEGGYEFAYGGLTEYDITRLITDIKKDANLLKILQDASVTEVGLGAYVKDGISYYDIIFITSEAVS